MQCWRITDEKLLLGVKPNMNPGEVTWLPKPRLKELYPDSIRYVFSNRDLYKLACDDKLTVECECGAQIPEYTKLRDVQNRTSAIRIAGPTGSGKTLFMTTMVNNFQQMQLNRVVPYGIYKTEERFAEFSNALLNEGQRPAPTLENTGERYVWKFLDTRKPPLIIQDIGGDIWEQANQEIISNYLKLPGYLIFVLDGATIADDIPDLNSTDAWEASPRAGDRGLKDKTILKNIIEYWDKDKNRIYKPTKLALVITKADRLWDKYPVLQQACASLSETKNQQDEIKEVLIKSGRHALLVIAEKYFKNKCRVFARLSSPCYGYLTSTLMNNQKRTKINEYTSAEYTTRN
jgi:RecA/RadA recombinase